MIDSLFTWLSGLVESSFWPALLGAFLWGIASVLLSPCHLTSIPLVVGYIGKQGITSTRRAFQTSFAFSFGILITIGLIGLITGLLGRMLGDVGKWGNYMVAGVFFLVGLYLMDIIRFDMPGVGQVNMKRKGIFPALLLGLVFGIALGPCTFAYMAPILVITIFSPSSDFFTNFFLLAAYGIGHCLVIVLAGTFTEVIQRYLNWTEKSKGTVIIKRICGVLVIIGGIYMLTL